jgi:hypothetical protein
MRAARMLAEAAGFEICAKVPSGTHPVFGRPLKEMYICTENKRVDRSL